MSKFLTNKKQLLPGVDMMERIINTAAEYGKTRWVRPGIDMDVVYNWHPDGDVEDAERVSFAPQDRGHCSIWFPRRWLTKLPPTRRASTKGVISPPR